MIGRERERARLRSDFDDVVATSGCRLFTLIGPAGIGKSRLVADFLEHVVDGNATVAGGRALSYGEGITYWPLVEMLVHLGIEPSDAIRSSPAETQLATRALLEERARDAAAGARDRRPALGGGADARSRRARRRLVARCADPRCSAWRDRSFSMSGRAGVAGSSTPRPSCSSHSPTQRRAGWQTAFWPISSWTARRGRASWRPPQGNPLFLEEMAALAREADGTVDVPPTIRALLQARLDALNHDERVVVDRGAVEGQVFHRGAVTALAPATPQVDVPGQLLSLVRKEVVRPDRAVIPGDDAFRFRHLLIRDTAYEGLPKAVRADLHERFADWLDANVELVEQDEIVGYHLERASRYRVELDAADSGSAGLARRAAERLGRAGRAALERGDFHATSAGESHAPRAGARRRPCTAAPPDPRSRRRPHRDAGARRRGRPPAGRACGGRRPRSRARNRPEDPERPDGRRSTSCSRDSTRRRTSSRRAGDLVGLGRGECARAWVYWGACRMSDAHSAWRSAREHLLNAGSTILARDVVFGLCLSAAFGGSDAEAFLRLLDELEDETARAGPVISTMLRSFRARWRYAMGEVDARCGPRSARGGDGVARAGGRVTATWRAGRLERIVIPMLDGDLDGMEAGDAVGGRRGRSRRPCTTPTRSRYGRWGCACSATPTVRSRSSQEARGLAAPDDVADQLQLDLAEAYARALTGDGEHAWRSSRGHATGRKGPTWRRRGLHHEFVEARIRLALGDVDGARRLLAGLAERYARRGLRRYAERYRRDLTELDGSP